MFTNKVFHISSGLDGVDENIVGVIVVVLTEAAAHDAVLGHFARQKDFDDVVELYSVGLQGFPQLLGLHDGPGKTVQQPAIGTRVLEHIQHHGNGDVVRHKFAAIDIFLGFFSQFRAAADVLAKDRSGFDMIQVVFFLRQGALGALAAAVGSENENIQGETSCKKFHKEL